MASSLPGDGMYFGYLWFPPVLGRTHRRGGNWDSESPMCRPQLSLEPTRRSGCPDPSPRLFLVDWVGPAAHQEEKAFPAKPRVRMCLRQLGVLFVFLFCFLTSFVEICNSHVIKCTRVKWTFPHVYASGRYETFPMPQKVPL